MTKKEKLSFSLEVESNPLIMHMLLAVFIKFSFSFFLKKKIIKNVDKCGLQLGKEKLN